MCHTAGSWISVAAAGCGMMDGSSSIIVNAVLGAAASGVRRRVMLNLAPSPSSVSVSLSGTLTAPAPERLRPPRTMPFAESASFQVIPDSSKWISACFFDTIRSGTGSTRGPAWLDGSARETMTGDRSNTCSHHNGSPSLTIVTVARSTAPMGNA